MSFFPKVYLISDLYNKTTKESVKVLVDNHGFLPNLEEMIELKEIIDYCLENISEEEIKRINEEEYNKKFNMRENKIVDENIKKTKDGYVYIIKKNDENIVKIGMSKNYSERTKQISTKLPFEVETVKVFKTKDMYSLEKKLHDFYKEKRLNGEWFELNNEDLEYIKNGMGLNYGL